jgi:hypothetical protein
MVDARAFEIAATSCTTEVSCGSKILVVSVAAVMYARQV